MNSERQFILELFRRRGLQPGGLYPLPQFLHDARFDSDPNRGDAKLNAFRDLVSEGAIIEMEAALELTEYGFSLLKPPDSIAEIAESIRETGSAILKTKDAELAQIRELTVQLTAISACLNRISSDLQTLISSRKH
jgi:hypothetical protein